MSPQKIHLVFKTHLDIGFTDHAGKVRQQYHDRFIPLAIQTGEHFYAENPNQTMFVWTTGAWLIWDHLQSQSGEKVKRLEQAIERGLIRWHALPFTVHSELMSPDLFRAGLSYSQELDKRFGVTTRAAKMTDVPGHTRGIVPLLAEAGVRFLHLGVNSASPPPDVPDVFRWRAPEGEEIVVMYQNSYGTTYFPDGFDEGLSFAHTMDNMGPQNVSQAAESHRDLGKVLPQAEIKAASLEPFADLLWARRDQFPVFDIEIGDSWIHGAGTDPLKVQKFLALQRLYDGFAAETLTPSRRAFGRGLCLVAEHTWGVDIKSYLRDTEAWDRPAFEAARATDFRFAYSEASWAEQRAYLDQAVAVLEPGDQRRAEVALNELNLPDAANGQGERLTNTLIEADGWTIGIDPASGAVTTLTSPDGATVVGNGGALLAFSYESYDAADVHSHMKSYLTNWQEWAVLDHDKPGLDRAKTARSAIWGASLVDVYRDDLGVIIRLSLDAEAREQLGAPAHVDLRIKPESGKRVGLELTLREKPANRMPEASFLAFTPAGTGGWAFEKMGLWQPAERMAGKGGGQLQATSGVRAKTKDGGSILLRALDTPLVAPVGTRFMPFNAAPPDFSGGIRFNLHNNKWGTNFPMWWEGNLRARFNITLS